MSDEKMLVRFINVNLSCVKELAAKTGHLRRRLFSGNTSPRTSENRREENN
jgi:hypothetical protein